MFDEARSLLLATVNTRFAGPGASCLTAHPALWAFTWVLEIPVQILMLATQVFYSLYHLLCCIFFTKEFFTCLCAPVTHWCLWMPEEPSVHPKMEFQAVLSHMMLGTKPGFFAWVVCVLNPWICLAPILVRLKSKNQNKHSVDKQFVMSHKLV